MRSLYDDIVDTLSNHTFSIPGVDIRKPFDESPKTYPMIVVHEIVNRPRTFATVTGEGNTHLVYQLDIITQSCVDDEENVLGRYDAAQRLVSEVTDVLDSTLKITRRTLRREAPNADVLVTIWRGESVYDASGYTYRP